MAKQKGAEETPQQRALADIGKEKLQRYRNTWQPLQKMPFSA